MMRGREKYDAHTHTHTLTHTQGMTLKALITDHRQTKEKESKKE